MTKISVLMSVYNSENFLKESLDSILNQTYPDFEFIIVNDASTDSSLEIIKSYEDPRIKIIDSDKNMGLTYNLNRALSVARGEFIARMDADDVAHRDRFKEQVIFMEQNRSVGVCGTSGEAIDELGNYLFDINLPVEDKKIKSLFLIGNEIIHSSVMIRHSILKKHGVTYDETFLSCQDYRLWVELMDKTTFYNLPKKLVKYREVANGITAEQVKKTDKRIETINKIHELIFTKLSIDLSSIDSHLYTKSVLRLKMVTDKESKKKMINIFHLIESKCDELQLASELVSKKYSEIWAWHDRYKTWNHITLGYNLKSFSSLKSKIVKKNIFKTK